MAVVNGIREKVHTPIYDCLRVEPRKQLGDEEKSSTLRFFVDVTSKSKLETNLQASSLLPHYNTFEARAMRVVVSELPPEYPTDDKDREVKLEELAVQKEDDSDIDDVTATAVMSLSYAMDLLAQARDRDPEEVDIDVDDEDVEIKFSSGPGTPTGADHLVVTVDELESAIAALEDKAPAPQQLYADESVGSILGKLIYNSVTTLYVGEKVMVEAPTWMFPAGAGTSSDQGKALTHGEPNPLATFRFAEPIFIDRQQNFRVEIEVPHKEVMDELQRIYGPFFIWVVLDGFMTRGVQ